MARAWQAAAARVCLPARPARSLASSTCAARDARAGGKAPGGACCAAGGKGGTHLAGGWCPCRVTRGWEESGERGCSGGVWMASEGPGSGGLAVPFPGLLPPPRAFSSSSPPAIPAATAPVPPRPPTPSVVLARIPAFLFRLTSPPRRREAGPRVDPGLFGGGARAVPCPPTPPRVSVSGRAALAAPWCFRRVSGWALPSRRRLWAGFPPGRWSSMPPLHCSDPAAAWPGPSLPVLGGGGGGGAACGGGGGRPAAEWLPRHGPSVPRKTRVPRAGRATDGVRYPSSGPAVVGGAWVRRFPPLPAPPRPPPSLQVPSASRRGGLKTPRGGRPSALGSGRSGRWGGGVPSPPGSASPHGAGPPCLVAVQPLSPWPSGGGLIRWPSPASRSVAVCERARVCPVPVLGGWEPPGACGVVRAPPTHPCVCVCGRRTPRRVKPSDPPVCFVSL